MHNKQFTIKSKQYNRPTHSFAHQTTFLLQPKCMFIFTTSFLFYHFAKNVNSLIGTIDPLKGTHTGNIHDLAEKR